MYNLYEMDDPILFNSTGKLHYVNCQLFEQDWTKGTRHSHEISELFFCIKGKGIFSVQDQEIEVSSQDFVFVSPYVEHTEWSSPSAPLEYICLGISGIALLTSDNENGFFHSSFRESSSSMVSMLSTLVEEVSSKKPGYKDLCSHIMSILFICINRKTMLDTSEKSAAVPNGNYMTFWIHQYLTDNFTRSINLDLLAAKAGINKYSLIRNFQKLYGVTPIEYALNLRFQEAEFLLRTTDHPVFQIATNLGFSSASYFSQCFHRREGISPSEYRLRSKQAEMKDGEN